MKHCNILTTIILLLLLGGVPADAQPQRTTVKAMMPLLEDEHDIKFVYDSELDTDVVYTGPKLNAGDIDRSLRKLFKGSGIDWKRNGKYVVLTKAAPQNISLEAETVRDTLAEARIISERFMRTRTQTGLKKIDGREFSKGYATLSSPDLVKTLHSYTGVQAGTEMLSGLYVHGGTGRDNLFLLDGVPLYQINHLAGLFSSFNTDIVDNVDFYKSGFSAKYGGRLSSVVDVSLKDGDFEKYEGTFSIGLLDGRLQFGGPIIKGKTSFNVSLRRSWIDLITHPYFKLTKTRENSKFSFGYSFHDLNFKLTHKFSEYNKLSLNVFNGYDGLTYNETFPAGFQTPGGGYPNYGFGGSGQNTVHQGNDESRISTNWGNLLTSLNWDSRLNEKLDMKAVLYWTRSNSLVNYYENLYDWDSDTDDYHFIKENNTSFVLHDISAKADFLWNPHKNHSVRFGGQYIFHVYSPERMFSLTGKPEKGDDYVRKDDYRTEYMAHETGLYIEDEMRLLKWFDLTLGLRYSMYALNGKIWNGLEPRVAANVRFNENMALKASYVEMNQYTHGMAATAADLPLNFWMPSTEKVEPMHSRQFAAEFMMNLPWNIHVELGGFYRTLDNIHEYAGTNAFFPNIARWESDFAEGEGLAYGAEAALGWSGKKMDVNVYYTLSWNKRKIEEFYPDWYHDRNDSRHKITVDFAYRINKKIDLYAAWNYHTGLWATCCGNYLDSENKVEGFPDKVYTGPSNLQLPDYHRLDIGANFRRFTKKGNESIWNVSLYNAYCRMNAVFITDWAVDADGSTPRGKVASIFPIIPSFSYTLKF